MENYIVSARKYRPATFGTVVGQAALTTTLKNAIASNRLAHAYLFCGSRGVGKTSCARIFAKTINCTSRTPEGEACDCCDSCRQFNENRSMNIMELDAASHNGVDDIRELVEQVMVPPSQGRYRVFIIDEVHMLSSQAFNAFLKTLEEPPSYVIFILATTEKHKIIPTILSRCQIYDFNRISIADMVEHMAKVAKAEGIEAEPEALNVIARKADGAMRDALSIFDQVAACGNGHISYQGTIANLNVLDNSYYERLLDAFTAQDVPGALLIYKEVRGKGFDSQFFINGLGQYLRDLMVAQSGATLSLIEAGEDIRKALVARAAKLHPTFLYKAMELCNEADFNFRQASNKQFLIELTLIKLCQQLSPSSDNSGATEGLKPLVASTAGVVSGGTTAPQTTARQAAAPAPHVQMPPSAPRVQPQACPQPSPAPVRPAPAAPRTATASPQAKSEAARQAAAQLTGGLPGIPVRRPHAPESSEAPVVQVHRDKNYSHADMEVAWDNMTAAHTKESVLHSVLKYALPVQKEGDVWTLRVAAEMQEELLRKALSTITAQIRNLLENDNVEFEIKICPDELPKRFWTEEQILADVVEQYPSVKKLIQKFQLRKI